MGQVDAWQGDWGGVDCRRDQRRGVQARRNEDEACRDTESPPAWRFPPWGWAIYLGVGWGPGVGQAHRSKMMWANSLADSIRSWIRTRSSGPWRSRIHI